jgi:N-acetylglucosaminyldiphosphoundecaprenol N-acetyl-beta-D-mannosaminyltransferase
VQIPEVIARMEEWLERRDAGRYIAVTGMHGVMEARHDANFAGALRQADLVVPDGMPLVWLGRRQGYALPRRVYGPELMLRVFEEAATCGYRHFFYGGAPGVADALAESFAKQFPNHTIVGAFSPPYRALTPEEDAKIVDTVRGSNPDFIWVGLGTPKQERWMRDHKSLLAPAVLIGVGAAFDFHSGRARSAPAWMSEHGLEWLFRLWREPRRLWRRYLLKGGEFVALVVMELLREFGRGGRPGIEPVEKM